MKVNFDIFRHEKVHVWEVLNAQSVAWSPLKLWSTDKVKDEIIYQNDFHFIWLGKRIFQANESNLNGAFQFNMFFLLF